jgi:hypothetical protein
MIGVPLPACYPSLWRVARGFDVRSLKDVDLCNMFHAHLMHTELVGGGGDARATAGHAGGGV